MLAERSAPHFVSRRHAESIAGRRKGWELLDRPQFGGEFVALEQDNFCRRGERADAANSLEHRSSFKHVVSGSRAPGVESGIELAVCRVNAASAAFDAYADRHTLVRWQNLLVDGVQLIGSAIVPANAIDS